jgi:GNAT superfamily N-acetyltransferase
MVDPEWQGVGLGRVLQARTIEYASVHGVRGFTADILSDNAAMLAVFRRSGYRVTSRSSDGVVEVKLLFDERAVDQGGGDMEPRRRGRTTAPPEERRSVAPARRSSRARVPP